MEQAGWAQMAPVRLITETFCGARYGQRRLSREEYHNVEAALRDLRGAKRPRRRTEETTEGGTAD